MNGAPHESLCISAYHALYGCSWKIFNPVQRSASKVPAVDDILKAQEATKMEVDMAESMLHSARLSRQTNAANP